MHTLLGEGGAGRTINCPCLSFAFLFTIAEFFPWLQDLNLQVAAASLQSLDPRFWLGDSVHFAVVKNDSVRKEPARTKMPSCVPGQLLAMTMPNHCTVVGRLEHLTLAAHAGDSAFQHRFLWQASKLNRLDFQLPTT